PPACDRASRRRAWSPSLRLLAWPHKSPDDRTRLGIVCQNRAPVQRDALPSTQRIDPGDRGVLDVAQRRPWPRGWRLPCREERRPLLTLVGISSHTSQDGHVVQGNRHAQRAEALHAPELAQVQLFHLAGQVAQVLQVLDIPAVLAALGTLAVDDCNL